ncbi:MAG: response regulator [Fibrobacterales bacterium]
MKILIVDDNFINRKQLKFMLSELGDSDLANDGKEALEAISIAHQLNEYYDLICMDIMMPQMDGMEALEKIRAFEQEHSIAPDSGAKIIMITTVDDKSSIIKSFRSGCESYVVKPVVKHKLLETIKNLEIS